MTTMKQAKRTYVKPAMRTVALQHRMALLQASLQMQRGAQMEVTYQEEDF